MPWRVKCRRMVKHLHCVSCFGSENWSWSQARGCETKAMRRLFRSKKKEDENFTGYCQRTARAVRTIWTKMKLPFLSEVIAEGTWRGVGWTCDPKPTAVLTTLKHAFKWRCTKVVAEYTSNRNHRGLVQPHDMETHVGLAQSWVCLGQDRLQMVW